MTAIKKLLSLRATVAGLQSDLETEEALAGKETEKHLLQESREEMARILAALDQRIAEVRREEPQYREKG